jgi:hypothetical protein
MLVMKKDPILEEISDRIRMGIPVSILEGIAAIEYQERVRRTSSTRKVKSLFTKFLALFRRHSK